MSLDDLCAACDIPSEELFGAVAKTAFANGYDLSSMIAGVFRYLEVVELTIKGARKEGGSRKRERLLVQAGLIT